MTVDMFHARNNFQDLRFGLFQILYFENTNLSIFIGSTVGTTENGSVTFGTEGTKGKSQVLELF